MKVYAKFTDMFKYVLKGKTVLPKIFLLLTLMNLGAASAWAQTNFSGTYYIANEANHAAAINTRWYLVPGADPHQSHYADAYFSDEYCNKSGKGDYKTTYGDPEKPFLTTYQTNQDLNSIWIISSAGDGSYYIKHAKTGKYVIYEPPYKDAIQRKSMHLESTETPGDNAKFTITGSLSGPINIRPTSITSGNRFFNPATGVGNRAYYYGPSGDYFHDGMIGLWNASDGNSQWYLEKTVIPPTITYDEETGEATITSVPGTTIRYAFDGTAPTSSSTTYSAPVSMEGHTIIKAITVDDQGTTSNVVTLTLKAYTYKIVNKAGTVAIKHTIKQVVGKQLSKSYTDIPDAIRSPYLKGEEVTFLSNFTDFDHLDDYRITETPSTDADIYVTYTTTHLGDKFLHLSGARPLNLKVKGEYIYDSGSTGTGTFSHTSSETDIATNRYFWFFEGEDPYAIEIRNGATDNYIGYTPSSSPTSLTLSSAKSKFIIMATSGGGAFQQMELMAATGDGNYYRIGRPDNINISTTATGDASLQIWAYPNSATITYKLIDQAGKILMDIKTKSDAVELPSDWQSPLVEKYNYWKVGAFDITGDVYKLKADPESFRINNITDAEGDVIYVTYKVNNRVSFDITDDDVTHSGEYTTYMLRFYGDKSFLQENGKDGLDVSAQKAEYPYSNGDAMLYVYSDAKREAQFASGASTRPRWLWYVVSPKAAKVGPDNAKVDVTPGYIGDPYHVKIMSNSGQASSHNYFRTYVVNYDGSDHVVTGVTTKNENVDASHANQLPTEYMVLSAPNSRYKLVTVNEIEGAPKNGSYGRRQTVNTFEQYWKNNPTVQNRLGDAKVTASESTTDDGIELTSTQASILSGWHTYQAWANAAPWVSWSDVSGSGKQYHNKYHWFQTIDMGASGEFTFEAQSIDPEVILLDQHGWEIMRAPLSDAEALRKYDSPMVQEYQWYPTAAKVTGYHKYKVSNPNIPVYYSITEAGKTKWYATGDSVTFTSTTLGANPYDYIVEKGYEAQDNTVKTDFYVTYTVKPEYARLYAGAATEGAAVPSAYMVKQGNEYAKINNDNQLAPTTDNPYALASIGDEWHWYVKPNFNIDEEMGYEYDVEEDDGAGGTYTPNQAQKDALNFEEGRNGFDPYNIQIQSVKNGNYYFKTTTTGSHLNKGAWEGESTELSLKNMSAGRQEGIDGNDQTKLSITNATFMVVKDASGRMLLMPRFDHTKVVNSLSGTTQLVAPDSATQSLELIMAPKIIHSSNEFAALNGQYTLASDFKFEEGFTSLGSSGSPFTGSIDGALHTLTGLSTPLIAYADGAIVKSIILENVTITNAEDVPNVGAIVANATGETRIYNCGINAGSVSGTGNVGSIVGNLDGTSRVINCYSYANVRGTTNTGGIVGYNAYKSTSASIKTMVMNCMFYGDVTGGKVSPIYGGEIIDNLRINNSQIQGLNNFNYYAYEKATSFNALKDNNSGKVYNNALAIEERFLTRFEIYRQLLNSNRKLAAYYATSTKGTVKPSDMMKWVLETADRTIDNPKPYPILKVQYKYPSIINYDVEHAPDSATVGRNHGGKLGKTLTVHLSGTGITTSTLELQRTDKDFDHFNFNYDKVQLPYFNDVGTGNYTDNKVVTGWKITAITAVAGDPYKAANYPSSGIKDYPDHNYADRKSSNKDLYSVSGRVFSQGAYFDVPYGVSEITIEPYWGTAVYVADEYLDYVYDTGWNGTSVTQLDKNFPTGKITINGSEQVVYKSIGDALKNRSSSSVYDLAIVLVGNLHQGGVPSAGSVPFTIMSVDLDHDNEPDYSYIYSHGARAKVSPIRFDFINVPGTAQAQKPRGATQLRNAAIFNTIGWFELTNTSLMYFSQIEYENNDQTLDAPMILQGGVVDQFVSTVSHSVDGNTIYIHVGGNAWFKSFTMGTHGDGSKSTPHVPVSVTGGDYDSFYLTGMYNSNADVRDDNAECYISGGRFGEVAGAGQEQIGTTGTKTNGNIRWQIYNADISEFYGGGINEAKPVQGNIQTDIFNSYVDKFCGGPKFGNMAKDKTVVTNAIGCTFEKYFGAGNGGNSYSRKKYYDKEGVPNEGTWNTLNGYYTTDRGKFFDGKSTGSSQTSGKDYGKKGYGVATDFDYEFFVWTSGTAGVRIYVNFASFSLAQCNDVTSTLTNCTINQDFYGGGNLGSVVGKATSTLDGCTVHGNVFGGGYSAELPKIPVRDAGFTKYPNFNTNSGMFEPGVFSPTTNYEWKHVDNDPANGTAGTESNQYVKTKANLDALGQVAHTDLTVQNNCLIDGGVYGGGDESAVNQNTLVKIDNGAEGIQNTISNVYGGGNTADVLGDTEVRMTSGTVSQDIYGGGRGETTKVGGNVTVNIGAKAEGTGALSGTGTVEHDVYGGSALGDVNTTADKTTTVNVYGGTVNGSVFGGGLGQEAVAADPEHNVEAKSAIVALSQGETTVNMEGGTVKTAVYGGSNVNGVLQKNSTVTLLGGIVGDAQNQDKDVVFGGGKGAPTLVNGNVTVNVGTMTPATPPAVVPTYTGNATIHGHVYGGGELGNTNASKPESELVFDATKKTRVNLYAGTINGYAYGGALGSAETPAYVGGDVTVTLDGAKVQQVFGANNINGTPKGHVLVHVKRTTNFTSDEYKANTEAPRTSRTTYDVEAVYGGGNMADYVPTNATLVTDPEAEGYDPGNAAKVAAATAEVLIEGCQKTSINYVYGGGNAAAVPATDVTVKGSYIINTLYGGGNGESTPTFTNPGANVGIYKNGETPTNYGTGKAVTKLLGGYINDVYGGSNTKGDVRGGTDVRTKGMTEVVTGDYCTDLYVGEIYGAGSHADVKGDVNIILECMPEDFVDAVYGGAEEAIIEGNVTLTVTSGRFGRVFGGNNKGGDIHGSITVNAKEEGCKPLEIGELYGGGNEAPYSHFGCTKVGETWTPNTTGTDYTAGKPYAVVVNVDACTSIGKVFGGGNKAEVIGDTHVDVNLFRGLLDGNPKFRNLGKIGQVFGGGNLAKVIGNTKVDIGTDREYINETGNVDEGQKKGVLITKGTYTSPTEGTYISPTANQYIEFTEAGVYGGGNDADVEGNTTVNIGTAQQTLGINIAGDIFGGGLGKDTHVTGNVTVNIGADTGVAPAHNYVGYAQITGDVYGGSAKGKVNTTDGSLISDGSPTTQVNFYGGTIKGNLYGGGLGEDNEGTENDHAADVYGPVTVTLEKGSTTNTVVNNVFGCNNVLGTPKNTVTVNINGGTVNNSVYGGGNQATYTPTEVLEEANKIYPAVNINNGTITENVFGGGLGTTATVTGNPHVTMTGGDVKKSVYGGGSLATVDGSTNIVVNGGTIGTEGEGGATYGNIYGGGFGSSADVRIGLVKGNTYVTVKGGHVLHNIYGGGAYGSVGTYTYKTNDANAVIDTHTDDTGKATIRIIGGTIGTNGHENGMIFGASRGDIAAPDAIQDNMAWVYDTEVEIGTSGEGHGVDAPEPQIKGSVYGSGENGHTYRNASVTIYSGMVGITDPSIDGGAAYAYRGNVYGGGCGTDKYYSGAIPSGHSEHDGHGDKYNKTAGIVGGDATVTISGGHVVRNVYGAGAMGSVTGKTTVNISGNSIIGADGSGGGYVYAAARGNEGMDDGYATVGSTALNISGGTIWGSAFGGGQLGTVKGSVAVTVSGGTVKNDVYGGGALANTNTDNWNTDKNVTTYDEVTFLKVGESVVTGFYTRSGTGTNEDPYVYTAAVGPTAEEGVTYFRQIKGGWANDETTSTGNTTTVTLTGGVIGNAYGGGLGDVTTPVYVFGDVTLTVNDPEKLGNSNGVGFTREIAENVVVAGKKYSSIPITGSVFGCNNVNGTPRGEVTVTVYSTRQLDDNGNIIPSTGASSHSPNANNQYYEIQAVYGGGNQADYQPATGKRTHVYIHGCDVTSIEKVYGGGNSAAVPTTDVVIYGSYDIYSAFGGGNGSLPINRNGVWIENAGSKVNGDTNITCKGGKIGNVFGGSDAKGQISGIYHIDTTGTGGECALKITKMYGASNESDIDGDVNVIISGCTAENSDIEYVCGGSYNANIRGDLTLTITSGIFKNVFGGNDARGSIGGNIIVNIQEEDNCKPIIIQNLVGGGYAADYPGEDTTLGGNAKRVRRDNDGKYVKDPNDDTKYLYDDFTEGKITVNVKSATRIDNIYGGGFRADVNGDTEVNVNMVKGLWAGAKAPVGYTDLPNVHRASYYKVLDLTVGTSDVEGLYEKVESSYSLTSDTKAVSGKTYYRNEANAYVIDDAIGTVGNIYGGGNEGIIYGNSIVNIGSSTTVPVMHRNADGTFVQSKDGNDVMVIDYINAQALGAHITGDVFGGGSRANVTGNASVNICAKESATPGTYEAVAEGAEKVTISDGSVYGGGSVADVEGNTNVRMYGGYVYDGVYGGGLHGSVGTVTARDPLPTGHPTHEGCLGGKPKTFKANTGTCTVTISGGQVGPVEVATKGMKNVGGNGPVDVGFVFGAGRGEVENPAVDKDADFHTFVNETYVTISGGIIMASVYGGGENGRVLNDTHVTISGGQIGCGKDQVDASGNPKPYSDAQFFNPTTTTVTESNALPECQSWDYGEDTNNDGIIDSYNCLPYDPYAKKTDTEDAIFGTDGHTYYGSVFGGGSGYFPYQIKNIQGTVIGHEWLRSAGAVYGNTNINITGGHILTSVYGGNETTDVGTYTNNDKGYPIVKESGGTCTITMSGGTIGVPRTEQQMKDHPVTCYLFGAGKGDQRTHFNTWTNVHETIVTVSGGIIYGSVFGGGEDGHVLGNTAVTISDDAIIGTTGTSYVDGNVFGGGRGFSGVALTAGSTGGNTNVTITGGKMLGSIYGGGRLASVGIDFLPADDPFYGQLIDDTPGSGVTHGHITVNISGGTIGNDVEGAQYGGNVFGAGMGRNTKLNGQLNELWPKVATSKTTTVTISGGTIKKNVYGGGEFGVVRNQATVNVSGTADIKGSVFGAGKGSDDYQHKTPIKVGGYSEQEYQYYSFTPMLWNGVVAGNTYVNVVGGTIEKSVYGGGELASVGLIDFVSDKDGNFLNMPKHESTTNDTFYDFGLSWPYKFNYHAAAPADDPAVGGGEIGGTATVNITGSATIKQYVYGGGKGKVAFDGVNDIEKQRYIEAFCANVRNTQVTIGAENGSANTPTIGTSTTGSVYGGGEDGHVMEDANVTIYHGTITHTVFGGGKGTSTFSTKLLDTSTNQPKTDAEDVCSWTAGKVYGNTSVTMHGGSVGWFIYGGGNMASVGKGNYTGGADDYSTSGYGELPSADGTIWTASQGFNPDALITESNKPTTMADYFLSSGKTTVTIMGGNVGPTSGTGADADGIPYGSIFGGSRGKAAKTITQSPRYKYGPDFFLGYVNNAAINIGGYIENNEIKLADGDGPTIKGSIYGGGQDGHVRNSTEVRIFKGSVTGQGEDSGRSGNVFGAGSGIGKYADGENSYCNNASGSVTCTTLVNVRGGTIAGNVYGGGALASVGPPKIGQSKNEQKEPSDDHKSCSRNMVNIEGGTISGSVYAASRGPGAGMFGTGNAFSGIGSGDGQYDPTRFATSMWTKLNVTGGTIAGSVYGGGEMGQVKESTVVNLTGGSIAKDAYGGGKGTVGTYEIAADVGGSATVELNKGVATTAKGCSLQRIFGCNDLNGTPKGPVYVHVYATQHKNTSTIGTKYEKFDDLSKYEISNYSSHTYEGKTLAVLASDVRIDTSKSPYKDYTDVLSGSGSDDDKKAALANIIDVIGQEKYDVLAVYGGGNLAAYEPTDAFLDRTVPGNLDKINAARATVIIDGCEETSIKQVYGGGNAASTPANYLRVNAAYEIGELFGGGNGKDPYKSAIDGKWYENPGANVGYKNYMEYTSTGDGLSAETAFIATEKSNATNKEYREANYGYGSGVATSEIVGGRIHDTYGGSNKRGNIRQTLYSAYQESGTCEMLIDNNYGASKEAEIDGEIVVVMDCIKEGGNVFGGANNAVVNSDITINITNGTFENVFGGNDISGRINGSITINVQENGCTPIFIDNIYGGGNKAPYSIYGFYNAGTDVAPDWKPRTKAKFETDRTTVLNNLGENPTQEQINNALIAAGLYGYPKKDPQINIISASGIGNIYGGGLQADIEGSTHINVNMEKGMVLKKFVDKDGTNFTKGSHTVSGKTYKVESIENGNAILDIGTIGNIFGGGDLGSVHGDTHVEIGTGMHLNDAGERETITPARNAATITGNVFGGGKGSASNFECDAAMVGEKNEDYGSTSVVIGNGKIGGNVYGGGEIARVEKNTEVTIGVEGETGDETIFKPIIQGNVYGAGQGNDTHGYSGLVRGNSTVTVQGAAKVGQSVFGGGEKATVGRYKVVDSKPTTPISGGVCTVTVKDDAEIGPDNMIMTKNGGPDDNGYVFGAGRGVTPGNYSYIGDDKPKKMTDTNVLEPINNDDDYLDFIETLGLASETHVTISGNAFIKGSVYGGGFDGYVQTNTHVTIEGGQIGNGYVQMDDNGNYLETKKSVNRRYTADEWAEGKLIEKIKNSDGTEEAVTGSYTSSLPECASWPYGKTEQGHTIYAPHDKFAQTTADNEEKYADGSTTNGGRREASDGHTFYGNVFGGGSGYYPYKPGKWHFAAGSVGGNTTIDITGGHILTNIYGGNEMTNVKGTATINFGGTATLGVPRTLGQITAHPVTCYLFGAGKGDTRVYFNKQTNVKDAIVNITGGTIYGSVFGGGEDGHVMGNVTMNIGTEAVGTEGEEGYKPASGPTIGNYGTSYVDGNVFGGGRGFTGDAYTAGNVAGSVTMNIKGGTMLGSIYGGGRLGSVGYDLLDEGAEGYGQMRNDEEGFPRGHVTINITGGTIGNDLEYAYVPTTVTDLEAWKDTNKVPKTDYESTNNGDNTYTYRLSHTKGGNVYAGGMGRREKLDGTVNDYLHIDWHKLGNVKSTKLNISGGHIKSNVYGGGEYGEVRGNSDALSTDIKITGGIIGTEIVDETAEGKPVKYTFGSVYGGGTGTVIDVTSSEPIANVEKLAAYVDKSTKVSVTDAIVRASVYGGGELGAIGGNTEVIISGATKIGRNEVKPATDANAGYVMFGGWRMGNVYGGGRGSEKATIAGLVKGNTKVTIQNAVADATYAAAHEGVQAGDVISSPEIYHNVYGGGALGSVGTFSLSNGTGNPAYIPIAGVPYDWTEGTGTATLNIKGGIIGISGRDNGLVFGSSRGDLTKPTGTPAFDTYDLVAWVNKTVVNIGTEGSGTTLSTPLVKGSVYGGGENGHNNVSATVNVYSGTVGITDTEDPWYSFTDKTLEKSVQLYRGNVYGAGSGSDTYTGDDGKEHYNPKSGMVGGNTFVNIYGGHVGRSVYGGGAMASVGTITSETKHESIVNGFGLSWPYKFEFADGTGTATVNITGGHIGTRSIDGGDVYGSARGEAGDRYDMAHLAFAKETVVNVTYPETIDPSSADIDNDFKTQCITGSVHGSGENGYVYGDTHVTLNKGLIGHSLYGAGKGNGTYTKSLLKIGATEGSTNSNDHFNAEIYSLIAGRVMGNTYVTMNGGHVGRNVYGGGNLGSVGKGNFASGADDYYPDGYGEKITGNLWTTSYKPNLAISESNKPDDAYYFLNSGKTIVKVLGGTVGYIDPANPGKMKNNLIYGNVFGGSAGEAAPNVPTDLKPRYEYCPAFFSGYVNETDVTIGKAATPAVGEEGDPGYVPAVAASGPRIYGSVYGGGQDGHVRRDTKITMYAGEIGLPYNSTYQSLLQTDNIDSPLWLHRGNIYGAGSGITEYEFDFNNDGDKIDTEVVIGTRKYDEKGFSTSSGSVTRFTEVNVLGGTIHRNVYGGGSMGSVGAPTIPPDRTDLPDKKDDATEGHGPGWQSQNTVNIGGGTSVVTIGTPTNYNKTYGGEVYGACRGMSTLDPNQFANSVWTLVNIFDKATIMGNVYGGGDSGIVKKDAEVRIGDKKQ